MLRIMRVIMGTLSGDLDVQDVGRQLGRQAAADRVPEGHVEVLGDALRLVSGGPLGDGLYDVHLVHLLERAFQIVLKGCLPHSTTSGVVEIGVRDAGERGEAGPAVTRRAPGLPV